MSGKSNYIVIADDEGVVTAQRRAVNKPYINEDEAIQFVMRSLRLGRIQVFGSIEHAPPNAKRMTVYLSNSPDGVGRIGHNYIPLMIEGSGA